MEVQSNTGLKTTAEKLKIEPFRIGGKINLRDAPIFEIENDAAENKRRKRRLVELKSALNQEEKKESVDDTAKVAGDSREPRDIDVLEVNAENDGSIEKDVVEPVEASVAEVVVEPVVEEVLVQQEGKIRGETKHHKKHKKHEKKKRRKEKTDEDLRGKRHKKQHRAKRSRSKYRSVSPSSNSPRRQHSSSDHRQSRDRSRNRSRERRNCKDTSDIDWRYSPSRFESRHSFSDGRSPPGNFTHRRGREKSPEEEIAQKRKLSHSHSPIAEAKKPKLPRKKTPRETSPAVKSSREKSPSAKSPKEKSPRKKSPRAKSPKEKSPGAKSHRQKSSKEKAPRAKSPRQKSPVDTSDRVKSTRKKSPRRKSPAKKSTSKSPSALTLQEMSDSEKGPSDVKTRVHSPDNELSEMPSRISMDSVVIVVPPPVSSKKSPRKSPHKSPCRSPRKSPHKSPCRSPRTVSKDPSPTRNVIVPYVVEEEEEEEEEEEVSIPANDKLESKPIALVDEDKVYVGITNESSAVKKKSKSKKKTKKGDEEKKKRKKKKTSSGPVVVDMVRNSDDELEDLLFTKTNKETKFEEVFHDSEPLSAKHNLRTVIVDVERKPVRREELVKNKTPIRQEIPPVEIPQVEKKTVEKPPMEKPPVDISPVEIHPVEITPVESPNMASEAYKPEEPTDESTNHFRPLEPPPPPPFLTGFFPSIPFLTEKQQQEVNEDPQLLTDNVAGDSVYSPIEDLTLGSDYNISPGIHSPGRLSPGRYSPGRYSPGKHSPVHLSDISTKESSVENAVGVITPAEKIEDFLDRMPGSFTQPGAGGVVDMDMSSPTNGLNSTQFHSSEDDDDIIEQLHKEFVRSQNTGGNAEPEVVLNNSGFCESYVYEPVIRTPSPIAEDRIVLAFKAQAKKRREKKRKVKKEKEPLAKEKQDIEEALNRVHRQARVEDEMKHVLKAYFKNKDITKEEYKMILRKAVPQVANSTHGIDPERIRSLAKKYVAKYKGRRLRSTETLDQSLAEQAYSPPASQDFVVAFSP